MRVSNSPETLQEKINYLLHCLYFITAYTHETLDSEKGDWEYHLENLEPTLQYNLKRYLYVQIKMKYLGLWVTCEGVRPLNKNLENHLYNYINLRKGST